MRVWAMVLAAAAGLFGAAGVALMAAGAHKAGPLATTAGTFLLFHAAAILALGAYAGGGTRIAASLMAVGALLFSGELAVHALTGAQPLPLAAPTGGTMMILGWLVAAIAVPSALSRR